MRITLDGRRWTLRVVAHLGTADDPVCGDCDHTARQIRIVRGQSARDELDTYIHEAIHAQLPWLREWQVHRMASELAVLLHDQLGYRRPSQ